MDSTVEASHPAEEDVGESEPLTLNIGDDDATDNSSDAPTKTPAERVRVILGEGEGDGLEIEEAIQLDLDMRALFCQMDVLCHFEDGETGWKEAARWLKYEEKVEAGNRWSKPHVATVSLHAIQQVKQALQEHVVLLNLDAPHGCVHQVAEKIVEGIAKERPHLTESMQAELERTLLRPHKHRHRKGQKKKKEDGGDMETTFSKNNGCKDRSPIYKPSDTSTPKKKDPKEQYRDKLKDTLRDIEEQNEINETTIDTADDAADETVNETADEHHDTSRLARLKNAASLKRMKNAASLKRMKEAASLSNMKTAVKTPINKIKSKIPERTKDEQEESALYHSYPGGLLPDKLVPYKPNKQLMKKIPGGSESANILIGEVDFLKEPITVFARLSKSTILADLTEVAIPTRFIFLVLGPSTHDGSTIWEYGEMGRAMAALLSDRVFCEVAYKASQKNDLIDGIDEYVDDLTVLPPSIWDPTTRLDPPEKTITIEKINARLLDSSRHAAKPEAYHFGAADAGDETLKRTGRLFGGLWNDIKRRYPLYLSDITDGFHIQCVASVIFLYFACVTPVVTFGGLLGDATGKYMGIMETMLGASICGTVYALFAGQPLSIVGTTGPMLVFESILYSLCDDMGWEFLSFRFFIGLWVFIFLILIVAFDLSALVSYITRFTEESFAVLISFIFIAESFKKLAHVWDTHPIHIHAITEMEQYNCHCEHPPYVNTTDALNTQNISVILANGTGDPNYQIKDHAIFEFFNWTVLVAEDCLTYTHRIVVASGCITEQECLDHGWLLEGPACNVATVTHSVPDVFFLCCFLFIGTFVIAYFCASARTGLFFPSIVRSSISDFAVLIAILVCTFIDWELGLDTPKLHVPGEFKNTHPGRGWVVDVSAFTHWWLIPLSVLPAALAVILIFLDQQITAVIVNRKEHKLQKGCGYHLDLFVLSILILVCSILGLPWFVAATVRAITHVRSLIKESELRAPGERPQFLGVREQRLTGVVIHILIGLSVNLTPVLQHIPMAVLYGVFLYMGVMSLRGVQFVQRLGLLFMPVKYQPDYIYLRHVTTSRVHVFTIIQLVCMAIMWMFKSIKSISICFPLMLLVLMFVRKAMDYFYFKQSELYWLDHILPDDSRRKKEDKLAEGNDDGEDEHDEGKPPHPKPASQSVEDGYFGHNLRLEDDDWNAMVSKRDYGLGLKPKPRRLSQDVISRYKELQKRGNTTKAQDTILEGEEENGEVPPPISLSGPQPFRQRKFSF